MIVAVERGRFVLKLQQPRRLQIECRLEVESVHFFQTIRVDDRLLGETPDAALGTRALRFLEAKLVEIKAVVPTERLKDLQSVTIVLDLNCGKLGSMQYHPSAGWLKANGYEADLAQCVHLPRAADSPQYQRATVGDPARVGSRLPRPEAGLR